MSMSQQNRKKEIIVGNEFEEFDDTTQQMEVEALVRIILSMIIMIGVFLSIIIYIYLGHTVDTPVLLTILSLGVAVVTYYFGPLRSKENGNGGSNRRNSSTEDEKIES